MADRRNRSGGQTGYIGGTAALKFVEPLKKDMSSLSNTASARPKQDDRLQEERINHIRQKRAIERAQREVEEASFGFVSMLVLSLAVVLTGIMCYFYLAAQSEIQLAKSEIVALQTEIEELSSANTMAKEQIEDAISLRRVYLIATRQLGMVHPSKNQIIPYKSIKSNVVRQYAQIPKEDKGVLANALENQKND